MDAPLSQPPKCRYVCFSSPVSAFFLTLNSERFLSRFSRRRLNLAFTHSACADFSSNEELENAILENLNTMTLNQRERQILLKKHCGVINSDDAIDPRHYFYNKRKPNRKYRKAYQLCRQVLDTLQLTLATEDEPLLAGLTVVDVVPAPDSSRMLVILQPGIGELISCASQAEQIMKCLDQHRPRLRSEIARSINRRKTPNLIFELAKLKPG